MDVGGKILSHHFITKHLILFWQLLGPQLSLSLSPCDKHVELHNNCKHENEEKMNNSELLRMLIYMRCLPGCLKRLVFLSAQLHQGLLAIYLA